MGTTPVRGFMAGVALPLFLLGSIRPGAAIESYPVAVIVNPQNTCPVPSREELRAILTLKRQFWSDGKRIVLILPPQGSVEKALLLEKVYHLSDAELRMSWANRLFAGEIVAVPSSLRTAEARVEAVKRSPGAIAIVPASAVTPDVRVLAVAGKNTDPSGSPL